MMNIKHVGVFSFGKFFGLSSAIIYLICSTPYVLITTVLFAGLFVGSGESSAAASTVGIGVALGMVILGSLGVGVVSFIAGLMYAVVMNFVLRKTGGVELDIEKV